MTYKEFWPLYLDRRTRAVHYCGTGAALAALAFGLARGDWRWLAAAPAIGYAPAWFGHLVFERNRPQTFSHPLWSLYSDLRMLTLFLSGRLGAELRRAGIAR